MNENIHNNKKTSLYKPIYYISKEYDECWVVEYPNGKKYLIDTCVFEKLVNYHKKFIFQNENDIYPSYGINRKFITLPEFIYIRDINNYKYMFSNKNQYDLRICNITITKKDFYEIITDYNVIEYIDDGNRVNRGRYARQWKNPVCKILNNNNTEEYLMLCNKNKICRLCPISYNKILEFTKKEQIENEIVWSYGSNGYILGNNKIYIHQVIMDYYYHGQGTKNLSVDHIDQDPLNNRFDNLRIATREQQEQNSKGIKEGTKRERKKNAIPLPDGINQDMLKKYVNYVPETYGKHGKIRYYFRIEKHPKLNDIGKRFLSTTKSEKVSIHDKLTEANKIVTELDNGTYKEKENPLPKYYSQITARNKPHLVYDRRREGGIRENIKMVLPEDYVLEEQIEIMAEKINAKYGENEKDN